MIKLESIGKKEKRFLPLSNVLVPYVAANKKCFLSWFFWHFYCWAKGIYSFFYNEGLVTFSNIKKNIMTKIRIINPWPPFSFWLKNDYVANFFWWTKTCSNLASWGPQWTPVLFKVSLELIPKSFRFYENFLNFQWWERNHKVAKYQRVFSSQLLKMHKIISTSLEKLMYRILLHFLKMEEK